MDIKGKQERGAVFSDATIAACRAVVLADAVASPREKRRVADSLELFLRGEMSADGGSEPAVVSEVLTYPEAAKMLRYRNARGVYKLVRKGILDAVYGGIDRKRSHGVTRKSVERHLGIS